MAKPSSVRVKALREPGRYGDGDGLYLTIRPGGSKSWILRAVFDGGEQTSALVDTPERASHRPV